MLPLLDSTGPGPFGHGTVAFVFQVESATLGVQNPFPEFLHKHSEISNLSQLPPTILVLFPASGLNWFPMGWGGLHQVGCPGCDQNGLVVYTDALFVYLQTTLF